MANDTTATHTVSTAEEIEALRLSFHTLACLADATHTANPFHGVPLLVSLGRFKGELTLDTFGNFASFK